MLSNPPLIDTLNWNIADYSSLKAHINPVQDTIQRVDWDNICRLASSLNNGLPCVFLDKTTNGLNNLVRLLQFSDQTRWIARISLRKSTGDLSKLRSEVDTMQLIKERSDLPVPRLFAYEVDEKNPIGAPFILMEFLPGNTAMDSAGGYDVHRGRIPSAYRQGFYRSVAKCHVQMTALRFPKIGTIFKREDGEYDIGPFPDIGGPFDTATSFFEAWAEHTKFPLGKDKILLGMRGGPADQVLTAIKEFPSRIKGMASRLSHNDHGPFPLSHADFFHSNIVVDKDFEVLGIIDWEGAHTLPLELITFPEFLNAMPTSFDLPENYDEDGQPVDEEGKERWKSRNNYAEMVKLAEDEDNVLSTCLSNEKGLALAYSLTSYQNGKLGFYDKVTDELDMAGKIAD
ncbi:kinase-like domain-containing protein [Annulohypoxylon maeteangense]|uniref:kinase-like domain-containing protein n=1 Tax=Annulohypoxylon maeteangense TaxID=1927788 RepID=UPI00200857E9|nr:kinase-like domain-containing protein [Annulohypoxylon maeteangense]KAI0880715.1 kinase-like domain-containing protein [Annulohypoxylon maeteangense]